MQATVSFWGSLLLPRPVRKVLLNLVMRPFEEPVGATREDVWLLRNAPLMPRSIPIHGLVRLRGWGHWLEGSARAKHGGRRRVLSWQLDGCGFAEGYVPQCGVAVHHSCRAASCPGMASPYSMGW